LVISSSLASLAKFMSFSAINIRSSGSNTKSNPLADFWSPYNEEPLDENYHFMGEYSFLFALPSDRVRGGGFRPPHRRHGSSMGDIRALTPLGRSRRHQPPRRSRHCPRRGSIPEGNGSSGCAQN
jgi:hypothetical protein